MQCLCGFIRPTYPSDHQTGRTKGNGMSEIDQLRADFSTVRAWMVACEEWSAEDAVEIGAGIADAVQRQIAGEMGFWRDWMAHWAGIARAHDAQMAALDRAAAAWWLAEGRKAA